MHDNVKNQHLCEFCQHHAPVFKALQFFGDIKPVCLHRDCMQYLFKTGGII